LLKVALNIITYPRNHYLNSTFIDVKLGSSNLVSMFPIKINLYGYKSVKNYKTDEYIVQL